MLRTVCVAFISLNVFVSIWAVALPEGETQASPESTTTATTEVIANISSGQPCEAQLVIYQNRIEELEERLEVYATDKKALKAIIKVVLDLVLKRMDQEDE